MIGCNKKLNPPAYSRVNVQLAKKHPQFLELTKHSFNGNYFLMFNDDYNEGIIRLYTVMYKIELKDKNKLILNTLRSWAFL